MGAGAFLNGKQIHCTKIEQLEDACIGHEVSFLAVKKHRDRNAKQVISFASAAQGYFINFNDELNSGKSYDMKIAINFYFFFSSTESRFRSFGSVAISLSFVARGTLDGYQINELYAWDIAAGILLIREAGGYCCKPDGSPIDLNDPKLICGATKCLCNEMIEKNKEALNA